MQTGASCFGLRAGQWAVAFERPSFHAVLFPALFLTQLEHIHSILDIYFKASLLKNHIICPSEIISWFMTLIGS